MIDFRPRRGRFRPDGRSSELIEWTEPARTRLGLDVGDPGGERRPARSRGARRRSLDRGDLPRRGRRDPQDVCTRERRRLRAVEGEETEKPSGGGGADGAPAAGEGGDAQAPTEEELRAQLEEELRKVRIEDVLLQSVVRHPQPVRPPDRQGRRAGPRAGARSGSTPRRRCVELHPRGGSPADSAGDLGAAAALRQVRERGRRRGGRRRGTGLRGRERRRAPSPRRREAPRARGKGDSGLWTPPGS